MASDGAGSNPRDRVKGAGRFGRSLMRGAATALGLLVVAMFSIQFARIIGRNVGEARNLASVRSDITQLEKRRAQQRADIARLRDPAGALPEIHDRLRMVRPNEELIFVRPAPQPQPTR